MAETRKITVRLDLEPHRMLSELADATGASISAVVQALAVTAFRYWGPDLTEADLDATQAAQLTAFSELARSIDRVRRSRRPNEPNFDRI